jgi:predicted HD superfamily hydrolase involved in NAD metabolism
MPQSPTYTELHGILAERLGTKALGHCESVADVAAKLADAYGVDRETARIAGLLHDWAREMTADELLSAAEAHEMETTAVDMAVPYLLHARAGAAEVRATFPELPEEISRAVELHTLGSPEMSELDKVVYIADMIEPARSFKGVDKLRDAVGELDLDELFLRAYAQSVVHLVRKRRRIHPETVRVWNTLVAEEHR